MVVRHWVVTNFLVHHWMVPNLMVNHWMVPNLVVYQCWMAIDLVVQRHAVDSQGVEGGLGRRLGCILSALVDCDEQELNVKGLYCTCIGWTA